MNSYTCLRCGHAWKFRTECPSQCPKCKSYDYDRPPTNAQRKGLAETTGIQNVKRGRNIPLTRTGDLN